MARFLLGLVELGVSAAMHLLFAFYVFSTAVAGDISQSAAATGCPLLRRQAQPAGLVDVAATGEEDVPVVLHGLPPPIVLVHGIFSFGKGGHYPVWDEQNPVHFVGHSAGAQVVRVLHQMLADKAFPGHDTSEDWVLSLTSLSGALNGTTRTYYDGMLAEYGRSMKSISLLQLCRLGVIVYDWLNIPWLKNYYNFSFDHFEMSWRTIQTCYPVAYPFLYTLAIVLIFEGAELHGRLQS